jgi:hypothetical protein
MGLPEKQHLDDVLKVAVWLIDNGLEPNSINSFGDTPARIAARSGNIALLRMLIVKCNLRNATDGSWNATLAEIDPFVDKTAIDKIPREQKLSPIPRQFALFSYATINFYFQVAILDYSKRAPWLTVSVFDSKYKFVEDPYIIASPATYTSGCIFWQQHWHMQTPLETLPPDSYIVIESSYFNTDGIETMKKFILRIVDGECVPGTNRRRLPHAEADVDYIELDLFIENALI